MADWKYISYLANDQQLPIIFPNDLIHEEVNQYMGMAVREHVITQRPKDWTSGVLSAGFISGLAVTGVHGLSESMGNLRSREPDASIINLMPYDHGRESMVPGIEKMLLLKQVEHLMNRIKQL